MSSAIVPPVSLRVEAPSRLYELSGGCRARGSGPTLTSKPIKHYKQGDTPSFRAISHGANLAPQRDAGLSSRSRSESTGSVFQCRRPVTVKSDAFSAFVADAIS